MGFLDFFRSAPKKRKLADISSDDLNRERITWQHEINRFEHEQDRLTSDEKLLKNEYASSENDHQKRSIARKIQDGRARLKNLDIKIAHCNKMVQVANNFLMIKENKEFFERAGVLSTINSMDVAEIEKYVNEATVDGMVQAEKLTALLQAQEEGISQMAPLADNSSLDDLMKELDAETAPARENHMGEKTDSAINSIGKELDRKADEGINLIDREMSQLEN